MPCGKVIHPNNDPGDTWNPAGLYLRAINGPATAHHRLFRLSLHDEAGVELPVEVQIEPTHLTLHAQGGHAEFCLPDAESLRIRAEGVTP